MEKIQRQATKMVPYNMKPGLKKMGYIVWLPGDLIETLKLLHGNAKIN